MTTTQTQAALLISLKDSDFWPADMSLNKWADLVCDELRRLDAENQRLQALLAKLQPAQAEPMFWVRLRSDGGYEGPIHNDAIEKVRKLSGAWHPLYLHAPQPAQTNCLTCNGTGKRDGLEVKK